MCSSAYQLKALQDRKMKSRVTNEQGTETQIKAVSCQVPSQRSPEEGTLASGSQEGRRMGADPRRNSQLQRRRRHSRGKAQPSQQHGGEGSGWGGKTQH